MKSFVASAIVSTVLSQDFMSLFDHNNDLLAVNDDLGVVSLLGNGKTCWVDAYGRSAGKLRSLCRSGE
jgi:hypothetical protein